MASSTRKLTPLQDELLRAFFEREEGFFLTGGGALAGFYLQHRPTDDLDLFTLDAEAFERAHHTLLDAVAALGGKAVARQTSPAFHRYVVTRGDESVVVDLVLERVVQLSPEKRETDGIRLDPPQEILANKLTALASRAEIRDLVDVMKMERAGYNLDEALDGALAKDGGCTPATLAWVLSQIEIPDGTELPGDVDANELRKYLDDFIRRLRRAAAP